MEFAQCNVHSDRSMSLDKWQNEKEFKLCKIKTGWHVRARLKVVNSLGMAHTVEDWSAFIIKRHVSED